MSVSQPNLDGLSNQGWAPSGTFPESFGRYTLLKRLGQGGMGSVFLAEDTQLHRKVALKVPLFGPGDSTEVRRRFVEEARAAATLDHPYLCPVYDFGDVDGHPYLKMAYIEGRSLAQVVRDGGMPQRQVAALAGKLALAMQEAHAKGVLHRDLKPANVMIKTSGTRREPVIVDFGLARRMNSGEERMTQSGQIMGTLSYMAPEQLRGDLNAVGPACDIYALGVILYELLTGRLPFEGSGLVVVGQILTQNALPPSVHRADLAPEIEGICLKAMARRVEDRYASMGELAAALTAFLQATPASADASAPPSSPTDAPVAGGDSLVSDLLASQTSHPVAEGADREASPARPLPPWLWPSVAAGLVAAGLIAVLVTAMITSRSGTTETNDPKPGMPVELLRKIDMEKQARFGQWRREGTSIVSGPRGFNALAIGPPPSTSSYQINVTAARIRGKSDFQIGFIRGHARAAVVLDGWGGQISGISQIDHKMPDTNESKYTGSVFKGSDPVDLVVTVQSRRIKVTANGKSIIDWRGPDNRLSLTPGVPTPPRSLFLAVQVGGGYRIDKISVTDLADPDG